MTLQIKTIDQYHEAYKKSVENPEGFWAEQAETFIWHQKWHTVLKHDFITPDVRWFEGGKLNITENCLDRHIATKGDEIAIIWEANESNEPSVKYTYKELLSEVNKCANLLKRKALKRAIEFAFICLWYPKWP